MVKTQPRQITNEAIQSRRVSFSPSVDPEPEPADEEEEEDFYGTSPTQLAKGELGEATHAKRSATVIQAQMRGRQARREAEARRKEEFYGTSPTQMAKQTSRENTLSPDLSPPADAARATTTSTPGRRASSLASKLLPPGSALPPSLAATAKAASFASRLQALRDPQARPARVC